MEKVKQAMESMATRIPAVMQAFSGLHDAVIKEGALSLKQKRLMLAAISLATRCEVCSRIHLKAALELGASTEEILETLEVAIITGGGPVVSNGSLIVTEVLKEQGS